MKKWSVLILIILMMIGACGCMRSNNTTDKLLAYINNKYDDTFEFVDLYGGSVGSNTKKIIVSSGEYPEKKICVGVSVTEDGEYYFDNYLAVKYENETCDLLNHLISNAFECPYLLEYERETVGCTKTGTNETTFREYVSDPSSSIFFSCVVDCDAYKNEEEVLSQLETHFSSVAVAGEIFFGDVSQGWDGVEKGQYQKYLLFKKDGNTFSMIEWTEGKL